MIESTVEQSEAPCEPLSFVLGRDRLGHWIVQETHGLCGGVFTSELAAIHYARCEAAERDAIIRVTSRPVEIDCSQSPSGAGTDVAAQRAESSASPAPQTRP